MNVRRLVCGLGWLLMVFSTACGTPDASGSKAANSSSSRQAEKSSRSNALVTSGPPEASPLADTIREIIDPVLTPCYSVQFPNRALARPVVLHCGFTGQVFLAVKVDTARRQLSSFRLQAVRLDRRPGGSGPVRLSFESGELVPDSVASLLPQLERHIRKLRPQVLVSRDKSCVTPSQWIIPIRVR